jgi:hypothetical protein
MTAGPVKHGTAPSRAADCPLLIAGYCRVTPGIELAQPARKDPSARYETGLRTPCHQGDPVACGRLRGHLGRNLGKRRGLFGCYESCDC